MLRCPVHRDLLCPIHFRDHSEERCRLPTPVVAPAPAKPRRESVPPAEPQATTEVISVGVGARVRRRIG
jgi:hypothetical protein